MAKAWKDVIASPQFQQLPPEQQAAAQDQYFNEVVAPQAGDQAEAARQQFFTAYPPGVLEKGNIDIHNRPVVKNSDGSISTVRSMSTNIDGREVLIPTVSDDGRIMSDDEAIDNFMQTGRHLGMFSSPGRPPLTLKVCIISKLMSTCLKGNRSLKPEPSKLAPASQKLERRCCKLV